MAYSWHQAYADYVVDKYSTYEFDLNLTKRSLGLSNIFQPQQESFHALKVHHITGLGFKEGEQVRVYREASDLVFEGEVEEVWEEAIGGVKITKKESVEKKMKVAIPDIGGIDILDEAGRSLGETALWAVGGALFLAPIAPLGLLGGALFGGRKRFKGFIVIHVKTTDNRVVKKLDMSIYIDFQKENSMTKPIICSHCGYQNVQHRSICHKCGEKLEIQPSETPEEQVHKMSNRIQGVIVKDIQMSFG